MDDMLLWTCPYDGLETPEPEVHLRAHGLTIDQVMEAMEAAETYRQEMSRLLLMQAEMLQTLGLETRCPLCGQEVSVDVQT